MVGSGVCQRCTPSRCMCARLPLAHSSWTTQAIPPDTSFTHWDVPRPGTALRTNRTLTSWVAMSLTAAHPGEALHAPPVVPDHPAAELLQEVRPPAARELGVRHEPRPALAQAPLLRLAQVQGALRRARSEVSTDLCNGGELGICNDPHERSTVSNMAGPPLQEAGMQGGAQGSHRGPRDTLRRTRTAGKKSASPDTGYFSRYVLPMAAVSAGLVAHIACATYLKHSNNGAPTEDRG